MAVSITVTDVQTEFPDLSAGISSTTISGFIAVIDGADDCLDAYGTADTVARAIKLSGVGYLLESRQSSSGISSERSANGASVSYKDGFVSANYDTLKLIDVNRCVLNILGSTQPDVFIGVSNGTY